jgi:hypothetical protein
MYSGVGVKERVFILLAFYAINNFVNHKKVHAK